MNKIEHYLQLLQKWNRAYNLTAITDIKKMQSHHIEDSLVIGPYLKGDRVLDVGTGAGLPGIPLAIQYPDKQFVLLDSNGKKIRFLIQVKNELGLNNVEPVQARMQEFKSEQCFQNITSRAVGKIADLVNQTEHLCCSGGQWLCMKGTYPTEELKNVSQHGRVVSLNVPGLDAKRHLVIVEKE